MAHNNNRHLTLLLFALVALTTLVPPPPAFGAPSPDEEDEDDGAPFNDEEDAGDCSVKGNTLFVGASDYTGPGVDVEECRKLCQNRPSCLYFTFSPEACRLSSFPIGGVLDLEGLSFQSGTPYGGAFLSDVIFPNFVKRFTTEEECGQLCKSYAKCQSFTHFPESSKRPNLCAFFYDKPKNEIFIRSRFLEYRSCKKSCITKTGTCPSPSGRR